MSYLDLAGLVFGAAAFGAICGIFAGGALADYDQDRREERRNRLGLGLAPVFPLDPTPTRPVALGDWSWPDRPAPARTIESDLREDR